MSRFTDPQYLKTDQYKDSSNLDARVEIHKRFSTNPYGWMPWVFDHLLALPANAKILELGCGPGYLWRENAARIPSTWDITLSDLSAGMIDSAWRNLVVTGRNYKFKEIDAQEIPFEDNTFDAVIANHMLYHVPDRPKALAEIKRVLKDDGRFVATTVGENHLKEMNPWLNRATTEAGGATFAQLFNLENGAAQLREFFSSVTLSRYEDNLKVTEVEPLMAYLRSTIRGGKLSQTELAKIETELTALLAKDGEIFITKASGLFEARKS